ncbi:hypothetical protein AB0C65_35855 [Nocardia sp. NPDC048505]|uniref:hypothetical protein n=1 Tax=Nocardia sp. NPDC048505 TaxID=3155756 RepID=UPI0033DCB2A2
MIAAEPAPLVLGPRWRARRTPCAIGFIRADLSPVRFLDEIEIVRLAADLGYTLVRTVAFAPGAGPPLARLHHVVHNIARLERVVVSVVLTPSLAHLDGDPTQALSWCDEVACADDGATYTAAAPQRSRRS